MDITNAIKTRISNKIDTLVNWTTKNPKLLLGEIAIVKDGNNILIKIGNGSDTFNDLEFINSVSLSSENIFAQSLSATSVEIGNSAQTLDSDDYAFVWNGKTLAASTDKYTSHGTGTFSINPTDGLSGIYIGEKTLADELSSNSSKVIFKNWSKVDDE